ncbi:hypothetical protein WMY93_033495 [Mugilogobius chulae]|uniref:Uncharacterized protein n=1 Tax=Mugilogobius chulae TaxID=88201 RepID=A0AAW0MGY0_9GOBI
MAEELQQLREKVQQLEAKQGRLQSWDGVQQNAAETGLSAMGWLEDPGASDYFALPEGVHCLCGKYRMKKLEELDSFVNEEEVVADIKTQSRKPHARGVMVSGEVTLLLEEVKTQLGSVL